MREAATLAVLLVSAVALALFTRVLVVLGRPRRSAAGQADTPMLVKLCGGDALAAARLVALERTRAPGIDTREATRRAIARLERDRER